MLPVCADETTTSAARSVDASETKAVRTGPPAPGRADSPIALATAYLMQKRHYLEQPLNDEVSEKFFHRYFEELDGQRLIFTQEDINEFASYSTNLDNLTFNRRGQADTTPAYKIFARFLQRMEQRVNFVTNQLKTAKFEFNTDERIPLSRRDEPFPRDLDEAKQLWLQRLRFEYLQEKIVRSSSPKANDVATKPDSKTNKKSAKTEPTTPEKKKTEAEEIAEKLTKRYNTLLHYFKEMESEDVLERYLSALTHVYDPHSDYMNSGGAANFAIGMNLALFGIGAQLKSDDGYCTIEQLTPNGPAEKSKQVKPKDRIVAVAQSNAPPVDVVDMNLNKVVQLIRGPKGSEVRLTIIPADAPSDRKIVALLRDEIKLADQEAKAQIIEMPDGSGETVRLGVIDLPSFYATVDVSGRRPNDPAAEKTTVRSTTADVARLLKKLTAEKVSGVILDLRRNGGGSLEEATALANLFIKGPVVQVRDSQDKRDVLEDANAKVQYDGPLVVLTSRGSASAAEIVAGALQDYGRALIVGDISTFGKATVQNINPLRAILEPSPAIANVDPGLVKVTIRKYYRPSGNSTLFKGVLPDIVLPSVANYSEDIGEAAVDVALGNNYSKLEDTSGGRTLGRDTIESVSFDKLDLVQSHLAELLQKSNARVATNQDFSYVREDIDLFRKAQADRTASMNEKQLLKEKDEAEARQKARDDERKKRKESAQKAYEIKLAQVDSPGLPPAITNAAEPKVLTWENPEKFPKQAIVTSLGGISGGTITTSYQIEKTTVSYSFDTNWAYFEADGIKTVEESVEKFLSAENKNKSLSVTITNDTTKKRISFSGENFVTLSNSLAGFTVEGTPVEEKPAPSPDATLEETKNILADYIKSLGKKHLLSSKDHAAPNTTAAPVN